MSAERRDGTDACATPSGIDIVLRVSNLRFRHVPDRPLIEDLSLTLRHGEHLLLTGANGSGKSSLLQLLLGLLPAAGGEIELFGSACRSEADFSRWRGRAALLFEDSDDQLFCPSVEEDIAFGPLNQGLALDDVQARVESALQVLAITPLRTRAIGRLSGGEKRLVALAGVLAMQPALLLLDEPSTALDEAACRRVIELLLQWPHAMIVVSHDPLLIDAWRGRRQTLADGRLTQAA